MCATGHDPKSYTNPRTISCPFTPRLDAIKTEENAILLDNFINNLFMVRENVYTSRGRLRPVIEAYMASLLFFLDDIKKNLGKNHFIPNQMKRVAVDLLISYSTLKKWGEDIKIVLNSAKVEPEHVEHQIIIGVMAAAASQAKIENLALSREVKSLKNDTIELKKMMQDLTGFVRDALSRPRENSTSSHKKRRRQEVSYISTLI
jgi:hypothetical protein